MGQLGSRSELNGSPTAVSDRPLVAAKRPSVVYRHQFGNEVDEFLKGRNLALSGETFDAFVTAYLEAKEQAAKHLKKIVGRDHSAGSGRDALKRRSAELPCINRPWQ